MLSYCNGRSSLVKRILEKSTCVYVQGHVRVRVRMRVHMYMCTCVYLWVCVHRRITLNGKNELSRLRRVLQIGTETVCLRISKDAAETSLIPYSQRITDVMKNNRITHKDIKWQYYGSEEGTFVKYPQSKDARCDAYDPRYRSVIAYSKVNNLLEAEHFINVNPVLAILV